MPARLPQSVAAPNARTGLWYVFPQIEGLWHSATAQHFAIRSIAEPRAYLDHPVLGPRYLECVAALQDLTISDPVAMFGAIDALKLRSSLTLFEAVRPTALLAVALDRWFGGDRNGATLRLLQRDGPIRLDGRGDR